MREGLRLVEEREAKLGAWRETIEAPLARGGEHDDSALDKRLAVAAEQLQAEGF